MLKKTSKKIPVLKVLSEDVGVVHVYTYDNRVHHVDADDMNQVELFEKAYEMKLINWEGAIPS